MSQFEDELKEILSRQRAFNQHTQNEEPLYSKEVLDEVFSKLNIPGAYGYLVYLSPDEEGQVHNGMLALGGYDPRNLSHAHRIADVLIGEMLFHECREDEC